MSASTSSDNTNNNGNIVPDEECSITGKYKDFSTTVKFSVDSIKERFNEKGKIELKSHEFKIKDESFQVIIVLGERKIKESGAEESELGVFLTKTNSSPKSIVSYTCKFLDIRRPELDYDKETLKKGHLMGFRTALRKISIDALPNNTLNLFFTVTLHSKEEDSRVTKKSRSEANRVEEELMNNEKRKAGLPSSKEKLYTDFEIESEDGGVIQCHRVFLASHSPVFKAMLDSNMKESHERRLKVNFGGEVLQHFVYFLYDTTLDKEVVLRHYEDFLHLADKYDIGHLKLQIEDVLIKNLSTDVMINFYILGDLYNAKNLKEAARTFLVNNKDCFKDKEFSKQMQRLDPEKILEIMNIVM